MSNLKNINHLVLLVVVFLTASLGIIAAIPASDSKGAYQANAQQVPSSSSAVAKPEKLDLTELNKPSLVKSSSATSSSSSTSSSVQPKIETVARTGAGEISYETNCKVVDKTSVNDELGGFKLIIACN
jgi:hypothetical protein